MTPGRRGPRLKGQQQQQERLWLRCGEGDVWRLCPGQSGSSLQRSGHVALSVLLFPAYPAGLFLIRACGTRRVVSASGMNSKFLVVCADPRVLFD